MPLFKHILFQFKDYKQQYLKKPSARERPTICPICYTDVTTHFTRHLFRHHPDNEHVTKIKNLPPKGKERLALVSALRKQGYFHLKTEKNVLNPVRTSTKPETLLSAFIALDNIPRNSYTSM
jgi:hypothetical protein